MAIFAKFGTTAGNHAYQGRLATVFLTQSYLVSGDFNLCVLNTLRFQQKRSSPWDCQRDDKVNFFEIEGREN